MAKCRQCYTELPPNASMCPGCGRLLDPPAQQAAYPPLYPPQGYAPPYQPGFAAAPSIAAVAIGVIGQEPGGDTNWGQHLFAVVPRAGDQAMLVLGGEQVPVSIEQVLHLTRPVGGGPGAPEVTVRAKRRG